MNNNVDTSVSKMLKHIVSAAKHLQLSKFEEIVENYKDEVEQVYRVINKLDIVVTRQSIGQCEVRHGASGDITNTHPNTLLNSQRHSQPDITITAPTSIPY